MLLWTTILVFQGAGLVGSMPSANLAPENITVMFLSPHSVKLSWATLSIGGSVDKYDVTYKPIGASYRVVAVVARNTDAVTLSGLHADTPYQVVITAVRAGKKYRSKPIVFRTLAVPQTTEASTSAVAGAGSSAAPLVEVRGVEVGIVLLVLAVWAGAIALFFNRWGKIRMLLPYQPDYKEQLKVPGPPPCQQQHSGSQGCPQYLRCSSHHESRLTCSRPRVNSAIYISSSVRDGEFMEHMPYHVKPCRRTRSAENIPLPRLSVSAPDNM